MSANTIPYGHYTANYTFRIRVNLNQSCSCVLLFGYAATLLNVHPRQQKDANEE